jgi:hypothetical protein
MKITLIEEDRAIQEQLPSGYVTFGYPNCQVALRRNLTYPTFKTVWPSFLRLRYR